jgi:hypothetical protein
MQEPERRTLNPGAGRLWNSSKTSQAGHLHHDAAERAITAGPRSYQLMLLAYREAGIAVPGTTTLTGRFRFSRLAAHKKYIWFKSLEPQVLMFPQSYVERVAELSQEKRHTFNFVGSLYLPRLFQYRKWILDFARENFEPDCYFCITSLEDHEGYEPLGLFDRTLWNSNQPIKHFVPKNAPYDERTFFDRKYFQVLANSRFTLCPRGDKPWSMRFFEAILSKSIPVVEDPAHCGRNDLERAIGYHCLTVRDRLEYRQDWVEDNYRRFIENQTLAARKPRRRRAGSGR